MAEYRFDRICKKHLDGVCGKVDRPNMSNTGFFKCPYCIRPNGENAIDERIMSEEEAQVFFAEKQDKIKNEHKDI